MTSPGDPVLSTGGEMGQRVREYPWQDSAIGDPSTWPQSVRVATSLCLHSRFPIVLFLGPTYTLIYNDAYIPMLGTKHPQRALGQPGAACWAEIWPIVGPMLDGVFQTGEATWSENLLLLIERNTSAEEAYFTFSYSPIFDERGKVVGVFTAVTEVTEMILGERRMKTLRALAAHTAGAHTLEEVCTIAAQTLGDNPADVPFALLYVLSSDGKRARLAARAGLLSSTAASPAELQVTDESAAWPLARVLKGEHMVWLDALETHFGGFAQLFAPSEVSVSQQALLLPINSVGEEQSYGFLVVGINPLRPLDDNYQGFLLLLSGQIATASTSACAYQEAQERAHMLAELDRAKTAFFSNVSHEFRTPLTLSLGPLEVVLSDGNHPLSQEQRAHLEMVRRNGLRQLKLVNTLLDFARIEAGRMEASYVPTDLAQLTRDLASTFRSAIEQAGLHFLVQCEPLAEAIYVDREMWEKIVLNLLSNAFKFTLSGSIRVTLSLSGDAVELQVQDTGVGMSAESLSHLFERFYRVRQVQARTQEGSGIGLSLVHELVRFHAGTITAQSTEGVGTTVCVLLPRGSAHLPKTRLFATPTLTSTVLGADPYVEEAFRWLPEVPDPGLPASFSSSSRQERPHSLAGSISSSQQEHQPRLLVIDDNADMRDYLSRLLSPTYEIHVAANGRVALALARQLPFDLIISDVMMPGLDGFALLSSLRTEPSTQALPVILLSARAGEEAILEGLHTGADDYLVKPFSARELLARVQARLEIARLRKEAEIAWQRLYDLFQQAPAVICILRGPQYIYELANPLYQQLVGCRDLIGKPVCEAVPELVDQGFVALLDHVYATGEPFIGNEIHTLIDRNNDGQLEEGYFNVVYQPSRNVQGEIDGILLHAVEVTQQVQARQRMDTFLGIASHELKSPLTSLKMNMQFAKRSLGRALEEIPEESAIPRQRLLDIRAQLDRADQRINLENRLVSDLIETSRIQAEKLILHLAQADLHLLLQETVEEQRQAAPLRMIHLTLPKNEPLLVMMDRDRILQVIDNYLKNALKYSSAEAPVSVQVEHSQTCLRVAVTDQGPGLSKAQQEHLWERFYQVAGIEVRSGSGIGLGLGLYICRIIIELHGGTVGVESTPGRGSTFWFTIPLTQEQSRLD